MMAFWLGTMTTLWVVTVGGMVYTIWRYVYSPWLVLRRDITALVGKVDALDRQVQDAARIKNAVMDDAEVARIERKMARRAAEAGVR